MDYKIINKAGRALSGFHSNGGWSIRDVFPCSHFVWINFKTQKDGEDYLKRMLKEAEAQRERWGDWTEKAIKFINTLRVSS